LFVFLLLPCFFKEGVLFKISYFHKIFILCQFKVCMLFKNLVGLFFLSILVLAFGSIVFIGFFYDSPDVAQSPLLSENSSENLVIIDDESLLLYDSVRFISPNISYFIDDSCLNGKVNDINKAFEIISEETILDFYRVPENGEIKINCFDKELGEGEFYHDDFHLVGTASPTNVLNTSKYFVIFEGKVNLYGSEDCEEPIYAIHEIFHVLGFKHSNNRESILYPVLYCDQKILDEIKEDISRNYADPIYPDLTFSKINIETSGNYLYASVSIINQGLKDSENVSLGVYVGDKRVFDFDVGEFEIGSVKVVNLDRIRLPNTNSEIYVVLDYENKIQEINKSNNIGNINF